MSVGSRRVAMLFVGIKKDAESITQYRQMLLSLAASQAAEAICHASDLVEVDRSRESFATLLETVQEIVFATDTAGLISFVNSKVKKFGLEPSAILGQALYTIIPIEIDEGRAVRVLEGEGSLEYEAELTLGDKSKRLFAISLVPLLEGGTDPVGMMGVMRDVTAQRHLEIELGNRKRFEALTEAAVSLNHELNNPLTVIQGSLYMLEHHLGEQKSPEIEKQLAKIKEYTQRISMVIKRFEEVNSLSSVNYHAGRVAMIDLSEKDDSKLISNYGDKEDRGQSESQLPEEEGNI